jgi:hypothetical protein
MPRRPLRDIMAMAAGACCESFRTDGSSKKMETMNSGGGFSVDLDRLERGVQLVAERTGQRRFRVTGGASEHWVDLGATGARPRCDCGDYLWRDRDCKHILAAMLHEGNAGVISAIGPMVARLRAAGAGHAARQA